MYLNLAICFSPFSNANKYFLKIFLTMLILMLGKFYESKRRKATGLKQQFVVMVAGSPRCIYD